MHKFEYSFKWKIENFSFWQDCGHALLSGSLFSDNFDKAIGYLMLFPRGRGQNYSDLVACHIYLHTKNQIDFLNYEIKAIGTSGKTLITHKGDYFRSEDEEFVIKFYKFVANKDVFEDAESYAEDTLTVCGKLFGKNKIQNVSEEYFMCTKIGVDRHTFKFEILTGQTVSRSTTFDSRRKFDLAITETLGDLKAFVSKRDISFNTACYIDCTFNLSLVDNNLEYRTYSEKVKYFFNIEDPSEREFYLKDLSREYKKQFDQHRSKGRNLKKIDIYCDFSCSSGAYLNFNKKDSICIPNNADEPLPTTFTSVTYYPSLQEDLSILFNNRKLSDVKLMVKNETIDVHKIILIARSPVFAAMFDHQDTAESSRGVVDIVDIDAHTLKLFLQFLYTDAVDEMNHEVATNLMMAAEKYQVLSLKEKCAVLLKKEMTVDNVCEILSLADAVNHEHLKSAAIEFIVTNSAAILSSPRWTEWMKNNMQTVTLIFSKLTLVHASTAANVSGIN